MEQIIELMTQRYDIPLWAIIGWFVCLVAFTIIGLVYQYKYRKAKMKINDDARWYEAVYEKHKKDKNETSEYVKDLQERAKQAQSDRNEFYEGRIKQLNERIHKATDENRSMALRYASKLGGSSDEIVKAAKLFHRHLQGKE